MVTAQIKLKKLMEKRKVKAYTLARKAGVPESTIKNILYGKSKKPSYDVLHSLATYLGCRVDDLFSDDDSRKQMGYNSNQIVVNLDVKKNARNIALFPKSSSNDSKDDKFNTELFLRIVQKMCRIIAKHHIDIKIESFLDSAVRIYHYCSNSGKVDERFVLWTLQGA